VTDAVHAGGGRIVAQLWHMGRLVHPSLGGGQPVSSSDVTAPDLALTYEGKQPYTQPRPLEISEIPALLADYVQAARNAIAAGFDGVQIHAANGYLIDQFLRDSDNKRDDIYGGSIENRIRLLGEVTRAVADAIGADRTSVRLSPNGEIQGTDDSNPEPLFVAAAALLSEIGIAFLEIREPRGLDHPPVGPAMRKAFAGPFIVNAGPRRRWTAAKPTRSASASPSSPTPICPSGSNRGWRSPMSISRRSTGPISRAMRIIHARREGT
jgi:N-ethylmaleimide reductase